MSPKPVPDSAYGPIHRAVWEPGFPDAIFEAAPLETPATVQAIMDRLYELVRQHRRQGTLWNAERRLDDRVAGELGAAGYWGLMVDSRYGGAGASFRSFAPFLTRIATEASSLAGLASVHSCLGAVNAIGTFGNPVQQAHFLPGLARGDRLSAFALTEPAAGSDLSAIQTRAEHQGDYWIVQGEKIFISNVAAARTIGLVCLIDQKPALLICELPEVENDQFQRFHYGLHALRHTDNCGLRFCNFPVPVENRIVPPHGDGLTIAYHGLNRGRVALCAIAAGTMRSMLANLLPWVHFRRTHSEPLVARPLIQQRLGRLAARIVGCDALTAWCSSLLDQGYRGELECTVAKIFGAEAQKEAAIELLMRTQGGRGFLHGQLFGDYLYDFLAPCIYEGESELLGLNFIRLLVKPHLVQRVEPLLTQFQQAGITHFQPWRPSHLRRLGKPWLNHLRWRWRMAMPFKNDYVKAICKSLANPREYGQAALHLEPAKQLQQYAQYGTLLLRQSAISLDQTLLLPPGKKSYQQAVLMELANQLPQIVVLVCTARYGLQQKDPLVQAAANVLCSELVSHVTPHAVPFKRSALVDACELGRRIGEQGFPGIEACEPAPIPFDYPA